MAALELKARMRPRVAARRVWRVFFVVPRRVARALRRVLNFAVEEQRAGRPARLETALRIAAIVATYGALMAALHVQSGTAQYALWLLVAPVGPMLRPGQALRFALVAGCLSALSLPLAGAFAGAPGLLLPFIGVVTAVSVYAVNRLRLGARGFVMQLIFLEAFYNVVVAPARMEAIAANTFAGYMIAFFTVALFDGLLWPHPAEPILVETLAAALRKEGRRLLRAIGRGGEAIRPFASTASDLAAHLALFNRAAAEEKGAGGDAALLAAITRVEQIFLQFEHIAGLANALHFERPPESVLALIDDASLAAIDAVDQFASYLEGALSRQETAGSRFISGVLGRMESSLGEAHELEADEPRPALAAGLGAIIHAYLELEEILLWPLERPRAAPQEPAPSPWEALWNRGIDWSLARFSVKTALAVVVCFLLGFLAHDPRLWVAPVTVFTVAFPTYGTALRRMFLRWGGSLMGGLIIIPVMILAVSAGGALPVYIGLAFAVVFVAGYAGQSSEEIAYAGRQIGDVFILLFMAVKPLENIYDPLWRLWGIFLGIAVPAALYWLLWPQHTGLEVPPRLASLLRHIQAVLPGDEGPRSAAEVEAASVKVVRNQAELLALAADARIEGPLSGIRPRAVVDACGTLVRLFQRFAAMSLRREAAGPVPDPLGERIVSQELAGMRRQLREWQRLFEGGVVGKSREAWELAHAIEGASLRFDARDRSLGALERVAEQLEAALGDTGAREARLALHGEMESIQRLHALLQDLKVQLAMVPVAQS